MNVLLDTHVVLWLASDPRRVRPATLEVISDPASQVVVSAASAWEVAIKNRLGRLDAGVLLSAWSDTMAAMSVVEIAVESADAILAGGLSWAHRDPFDRLLTAQALRRGLTIATRDAAILGDSPAPTISA